MKLLFVSQEFPPETDWGGIGTYAGIVTPALARRGVEVHVLSVVRGQESSDHVMDGVHVHRRPLRRLRGLGRLTRSPQTWSRVSLAAEVLFEQHRLGQRFDVCETPEWRAEGLGIALRGRLPLVVRLHSGASQIVGYYRGIGFDERLAIRCEQALIRRADLVTGTKSIVSSVAAELRLPGEMLKPIIYPVPGAGVLRPADGPPLVAFAGRLEPRKGPELLIEAAPQVLARHPDARFLFIGAEGTGADGKPYGAYLRELARRHGVTEAIEFAGRRGGPGAVAGELARATLCAVPSRWESMGYVAAEAAALGRPVVASRIPGLDEVVEDGVTGRLVAVDDVDGWARAILEILSLSEAERRRMGEAGARLVADRCDPELVADQTLAAYEQAIDRHRASRA